MDNVSASPIPFSARLFTITLVILAVILGTAFWGAQRSNEYADATFQTRTLELETLRMLSLLQDAEVGQRGYLLTEDPSYLRPYEAAIPEIAKLRDSFSGLVADRTAAAAHAEKIETLIAERMELLARTVALQRSGDRPAALALVNTGIGKSKMDEIRAIVLETNTSRSQVLAQQQGQLATITRIVRVTEVLGGLLLTIAAITMFRQFTLATQARQRAVESQAAAVAAATMANKSKSLFLATMSHELRTPMTAILGMCDLLMAGNQSSEERQITRTLTRSARTLLSLLNDILDISKIEAGHLTLDSVDFRLSSVLEEVGTLFQPVASQKGLLLNVDAAPGSVDVFKGDAKRLQQIVSNLVGNAIKFTEKGSITVSHRVVSSEGGKNLVEIEVRDTGVGVSEEAQARLFRDFEQEDTSTSRRFGGTGLGLSISKRLVDAMNGTMGVESVKGEGARFFFSVLLATGDAAAIVAAEPTSALDSGAQLRGMNLEILLAEDAPATQFLISKMMSLWGHRVTVVNNGEEAVAAAGQRPWDIILMDMQMPVLDGAQAAARIRAGGGPSARVPIIALTADAIHENHQGYLDAGCNAVAVKPVEWPILARHIAALVDPTVTARALSAPPGSDASPAAPPDAAAGDDDLPMIDMAMIEDLRASLGRDILGQLINGSVTSLTQYLPDLMNALAQGDYALIERMAHKIRGVAAQLGALRATELARKIEVDGGEIDDLRRTADLLEKSITEVVPHLTALTSLPVEDARHA